MRLKEYEIVIEPREIVFEHIEPNKVFTKKINIKNVGNKSRRMELFRPSNKVFQLYYKNPELPVPPGMEIAAVIEFQTNIAQDYNDKMVICIDNKEIDIPIQAFPAKPILTIDEVVDFGVLSANNKTVSSRVKVTNKGALDGEFRINYTGDLPITFVPARDVVPAYSHFYIRIDFFTKNEAKIEENIPIILEGTKESKNFKIKAKILKRQLMLLDSETGQPIQRLNFGSCYYGCDLTNVAILFNSSPEKVDYVVLLEEKGLGAEIGAELSKSTNALKAKENEYKEEDFSPLSKLVSAFPNNGVLEPFEKRPIFFRFTPQYTNPRSGFITTLKPPPRRDYAIFLYFELLGNNQRTELAITGTALPVLLRIDPNKMDFSNCEIGQKKEIPAILYNDSELKDVRFKFRKVANYTVYPASGTISPRSSKNVTVSFIPHQIGSFNYTLLCEVIDKIADKNNPLLVYNRSITEVPINLIGNAIGITNIAVPKYSGGVLPKNFVPGIEPLLTNEVGLNVNTTVATLKPFVPKAAVQNAANDNLHKVSISDKMRIGKNDEYKISFPNDRSKSIAPYNRHEKFKTLFTGVERYNYIDSDYAYTDDEIQRNEKHKLIYKKYLDDLRFYREEKSRNKEFYAFNSLSDAGLKPGGGIIPKQLNINELANEASKTSNFQVNPHWQLITTEDVGNKEKLIRNSKEIQPVSLKNREKDKLNSQLTPAQIYKIVASPSVIDFGDICIKSVSIKNLDFLNTLDQPIYVELETDCNELRQTNPSGIVIAAQSKGTFQIIFESEFVQTFQRSISYRINHSYRHHVIVLAESKLPTLKLSSDHLLLSQLSGIQAELCYRSNITIINPYNTVAEFTWIPIYGEQGTAFSIRPASGIIEPYKDLECEVVWHGSFLAPLKGTFSLQVTGGEATTLTCEAKLGTAQLQFINRRANFGKIPVNMTSTKTFYMTNTGTHNAYFQILDTKPIPGMVITPTLGLAPLNALTPIKVEMNPSEIIKFDARVMIQIRGGRMLELRLSGESEEPIVDINIPQFEFGGVFSGASCAIPFKLINKSHVKGKIEFNLRRYADYSIKTKEKSDQLAVNNKNYEVAIEPEQSLDLELVFSPTEVASYDFDLPMAVNKRNDNNYTEYDVANSPFQSDYLTSIRDKTPQTQKPSSRHSLVNYVPKRRITAIALRHALELSESKIHFKIPIMYFEKLKDGGFYEAKSTILTNKSHRNVKWCVDMRRSNKVLEDGIFKICDGSMIPFVTSDSRSYGPEGEIKPGELFELKIMFCPDKPGTYTCNFPIAVNNNFDQPYYNIEVVGELLAPEIYFEPEILIMKPVPLGVETSETIYIKQRSYENKSKLKMEIPKAVTIDGEKFSVLSADFVGDSTIIPHDSNSYVEVNVKFVCSKPISNTVRLKFTDEQNREYFYNVVVTSDNSLFTCYSFLSDHSSDYHIVLEPGHIMKGSRQNQSAITSDISGEPILRPFTGTSKFSNGRRTVSPTFDLNTSISGQSPMKDAEDPMQTVMNEPMTPYMTQEFESRISTSYSKAQEQLLFPSSDTTSGTFTSEILKILQRWFRCNGWPNSHNLVKIPESFRAGVSRKPLDEQENMPQQDAMKRENKTIYEMIAYLSGRPLPAIPVGAPVPNDIVERTNQFAWQHNVFLKFLEVEGGCVASVKPEYLLDIPEYKTWLDQKVKQLDLQESSGFKGSTVNCVDSARIPLSIFHLVSRKAWLDCLLQLLKVCVINRITPKSFKSSVVPYDEEASFPDVKTDPLISNIYSMGERILLTWLNYCYANYKEKIWKDNDRGGVPSTRWIVNFDADLTDSLALAAAIGAYCPFVIESHLRRMYMNADTAEKCFHNALILIDCCRKIGLDYDINSLDITDPNSISMILFCSFLYNKLPNYIPTASIDFTSPLHQIVSKQIKITNPSAKNVFYQAIIIGPNADNFTLPKGDELPITSKGKSNLCVDFLGNKLKPGNAYLLLIGKKQASIVADTLVFCLNACIDELTAKKIVRFQSSLYKPNETLLDVENPYSHGAEFKIKIIESSNRAGTIKNPYNPKADVQEEGMTTSSEKGSKISSPLKQQSKASMETVRSHKSKASTENKSRVSDAFTAKDDPTQPILSAFYTKSESIYLEAKGKSQISVCYLPLQMMKHSAVIIFSNEKLGEFIYYFEGSPGLPEPSKALVDESSLDQARIKLIKSNRPDNKALTFRCFSGDNIEIKVLMPVCNIERENALVMATEMRMTDLELKRRKVHGVLSSKSLLEAIENLTLNKQSIEVAKSAKIMPKRQSEPKKSIKYSIQCKNNQYLMIPNSIEISQEEMKSDENLIPITIRFCADRVGTYQSLIEFKSLPDEIRCIPVDFKVTESAVSDATIAYLQFNACVFETIIQSIPVKNGSEIVCNYEVEILPIHNDSTVFKGLSKFSIKPKDIYNYDLVFVPNAEEKFEAELRFNNITEGTQIKYMLTGLGERRPPLGEIKLETKVGQVTHHEVMIPNKSNKKICFYVSSNSSFIKGPDKIMLLPNRKEPYRFEIHPTQRGDYKGAITFRPGDWPIKDIDSDGEEMSQVYNDERPQQFTLWFTFDLRVSPASPQSTVEIEAHALTSAVLCIPLSNPFAKKTSFKVIKYGSYLDGADQIEINSKDKYNYELSFSPKQIGKFRGSLIFLNEEIGEFWYDLKLRALDPLPIPIGPIEAEIGKYTLQAIKLSNPLSEPIEFRVLISNPANFALERKQHEKIHLDANASTDVNILFTPSTIGPVDHFTLIKFENEKLGNLTYELTGLGLEPDTQDPINITSEIGQSQMVTVNFRNSTDSAIYCDLALLDEDNNNQAIEIKNDDSPVFNILLDSLKNIHVSPRGILDIPIIFSPHAIKRYNCNLVITARREARMSWVEQDPKRKIERLKWIYPIKAFTVINAINKATPFVLECMVRKRLEKRMEVVLTGVTSYSSGADKNAIRLRSITPMKALNKSSLTLSSVTLDDDASASGLVIVGDANNLASEFVHSIHFTGNPDLNDIAKNSIAIKLVRVHRDKTTALVTLVFDMIFCPSKSFLTDACLQVETALGGMWRYPLKLVAIEPPPDDTIVIDSIRLNRESVVGFRLSSKTDKPLPFKASFIPSGDQVFTVSPKFGELLPESEDGTLIKVGFTPATYGKVYQSQLIISTPSYQWKYIIKGETPEYIVPRGQSGIPAPRSDPRIKRYGKKRNYIVENTHIIQTAVSSPIKGAALMPMRYSNLP